MELPEIHLINKIDWQIFGTLTFKKERMPNGARTRMFFAQVRTLAKWYHVFFPELLWVLRTEQGELTGRTHQHCLIGGLPKAAVSGGVRFQYSKGDWDVKNKTCHALEENWGRMGLNPKDGQNRISRFSLYDSRLNGGSYLCKCLGIEENRISKDIYESGKFGSVLTDLTLSHSVERVCIAYLDRASRLVSQEGQDVVAGGIGVTGR